MDADASLEIRSLMARFRSGDPEAAGALVDLCYPELRRLAAARMRTENPEHTWTPTVLVNELYLELVKIRALRAASEDRNERDSFFGLAAHIMRRLLTHHARPLSRRARKVEATEIELATPVGLYDGPQALVEIEHLLERLAKIDPKLRRVVELRVFEGKTADEAAEAMTCSPRAVHKYWSFAKHWLANELGDAPASSARDVPTKA